MEGGTEGTTRLLNLHPRPDAIFACNDVVAIGAMKTIQDAGLRIPADCGLIGVGNVRYGDCLSVPLSTVELHPKNVGRTAATMLLGRINGQHLAPEPVFLEPELILRESSNRAPQHPQEKFEHSSQDTAAPGTQRIEIAQKPG
jgi:LacI family transcriptional regulator